MSRSNFYTFQRKGAVQDDRNNWWRLVSSAGKPEDPEADEVWDMCLARTKRGVRPRFPLPRESVNLPDGVVLHVRTMRQQTSDVSERGGEAVLSRNCARYWVRRVTTSAAAATT